ncbi:MAG: Uncharacterised protein [Flavobacterium sp. SCGC AAA160-P02]|nr:MAG: Uncharacterised protein [Flavobacterium sp. SCGC AAA160-P02]
MDYIQTAYKGKNDAWMYIIMFFIVLFGNFIGQIPITVRAFFAANGDMEKFVKSGENAFADLGIDSNVYLFLILLSFIVPLFLFILAVKGIHKKRLTWVITSRKKIDWKRFFFGVFIWGTITLVIIGSDILLSPENYVWNFKPIPFFILCVVAILFLPLQTSLEELLFRGYYMQGLALWIKNKWVPLLIISLVFGLLHISNPEVDKIGYSILILYVGTGLFFGIVTLMDEGTELALGMHAINNIIAALFFTTDWTVLRTDALFVDISEPSIGLEMLIPLFVTYPIIFFIFSKKYDWTNWKEKIFGNIVAPTLTENE